ncbi:MAG TPA: DNA polymerase III subunit delta' [Stellaceae bacterium]|nr:DNA polymerase III subunit delta' [Stellaceae bacterium]
MTDDFVEEQEAESAEDGPPGAAAEIPPPRANPYLAGHEAAEAALIAAHAAGRLPHALILGGPRGIGKATLAFRLARFLLAQGEAGNGLFAAAPPATLALSPEHPVFRRVAAAGHADLLTVERGRDPKRKDRLRGEIIVEDTRNAINFLRLTPAEGGWRIVIFDSADEMNRNAANAVLKVLEEPPTRSLLILVSHAPGRLLPTIRSRCRKLMLKPLAEGEVVRLLQRYRPELATPEAQALAMLGEGSIGRALELAAAGGLDLYRSLSGFLRALPELDTTAIHAFAEHLARAEAEEAYRTVSALLLQWLARMVGLTAQGRAGAEIVPGDHEAMRRLAGRRSLDHWVEVWEKIARLFAQAESLDLERKQVVLGAFFALEAAAR